MSARDNLYNFVFYKVTRDNEDVNAEKVTLLPGAPEVVAMERNNRGIRCISGRY